MTDELSAPAGTSSFPHHPCCPGIESGTLREQYPETWLTKDGRVLRITEMSNRHLLLTLRMLIRRASYARGDACLQMLDYAMAYPYDDVSFAAEQVYGQTWRDHVCAHFEPILVECRARDLKNAASSVIEPFGKAVDREVHFLELQALYHRVSVDRALNDALEGVAEVGTRIRRKKRWFDSR
jgi:hypothetical protein